ncbi:MAG: aminotransferase class III-fold pyridoxal phosphate-dependent enzyme [Cytophagales bacterium]|nr:aminotransferase class III-fold pyridoxal phosphate-dependent enzyme [Cytophagales bacterium]MDW8385003.1 aminotransferase class III-fold pyridoxal phosphate-dependent enzyme [Flammeovirgaceae bacterium]
MNAHLFDVYPIYEIEPVEGKGCYIKDKKGVEYLDFYGGHAVISIGHAHPHYIKRITEQLNKIAFYSNSIVNRLQEELAERLLHLSGMTGYRLFLVNSGAEANENALKLASFHTGRRKVIAFKRAFHGRTSAAVNVTDNPKIRALINDGFPVEFKCFKEDCCIFESLQNRDVAAVIIETIQGVGGIHMPSVSFLRRLREECTKTGTVLIADEIQCGYGRSGYFFAFQMAGIQPDIISVAKGMGNGFPIGGILIAPQFKASYGLLGTTFGGNHLACAAALAVLEVIEQEKLVQNAKSMGDYLLSSLKKIKGIADVRGMGLMIGLEFEKPIKFLRDELLFEHKIFTGNSSNPNVLRLLPPLTITEREANQFLNGLQEVIQKIHQHES